MTTTLRPTTKQETKSALIKAGMEFMLQKGYSNTGVQEVLSSLGVPKGSFYHYFESKEAFALAVIHSFDEQIAACLTETLTNQNRTPLERLRDYCEADMRYFESNDCRKGCLIGNLSQEMADQSEILRCELSEVMKKWRRLFSECIAEGQAKGEITKAVSSGQLAELFCSGWSGAMLWAKTVKTLEPLEVFIDSMFGHFLVPQI